MTANLILIALTAFLGLLGMGLMKFGSWQDRKVGASLEAGKVDAVTVKVEAAVAQAVVEAPHDQASVVAVLEAGRF